MTDYLQINKVPTKVPLNLEEPFVKVLGMALKKLNNRPQSLKFIYKF